MKQLQTTHHGNMAIQGTRAGVKNATKSLKEKESIVLGRV